MKQVLLFCQRQFNNLKIGKKKYLLPLFLWLFAANILEAQTVDPNCSGSVCGKKFYDLNANGLLDNGEVGIASWPIKLTGTDDASNPVSKVVSTDADGNYCFTNVHPGNYTIAEAIPIEQSWLATTPVSYSVSVTQCDQPTNVNPFGDVCLGEGGGFTIGFWKNRNGETIINDDGGATSELTLLSGLCLRNDNGTDFDPASYTAFVDWVNGFTTNSATRLSIELAAMALNVEANLVDGTRLVYFTGCNGDPASFITINALMQLANNSLCDNGRPFDPDPTYLAQICLMNALNGLNNGLNFVQTSPCAATFGQVNVQCPSDISVNKTLHTCTTVVNYPEATASSTITGPVTIQYSKQSGTEFPIGTTTVTVTATDANNNMATCGFTVKVVDNEPPTLTPPADATVECSELTPANMQVMPLYVVSPASLSQNYMVYSSSVALPPVPLIANLQLVNDGANTVTDACDGVLAVGSLSGKIALIDRGNCTFDIKVKMAQDAGALGVIIVNNEPGDFPSTLGILDPTITIPSLTVSNNAGNAFKTALLSGPVTVSFWNKFISITNVCGAPSLIQFTDVKITGSCPNNYQFLRSWTISDRFSNLASTTQTMTVQDKTAPVITCAQSGTVSKNAPAGSCTYTVNGSEFDPAVSDNCSTTSLSWSVSGATTKTGTGSMDGTLLNLGDNIINWVATDACSNTSTCGFTVKVNAGPPVTITGNATVCLSSSPYPRVTFSAAGGVAPYTFTYTVNGDLQTTVSSLSTATVEVQTNMAGKFTYTLVGVVDASAGGCFPIMQDPTVIVTVNPLPSADIGAGTSVCKDANASINFTGSGGTAPYTFTYTIFDGSTTSAPLTITSDKTPLSVPTGTPGNYTYNLINVADASTTGCPQSISGKSAVITVNPLPDATITTASPVTAASSGNVASVADAGMGATYSWTIINGTMSAGTATRSITYTAGNSGSVQLSVSVTSGSACGPVSGGPVTVPITALPCPNPAISVASSVCSASAGNKASVANAGTGAKYVWSITNGTITGGAGTNQITFTAATNKYADYDADDYVNLSVKVTNASGVCTESSGTYKRFISPIPSAAISTASTVCSLSGNNFASVPFAGIGAKYTWTITNGNITWGVGTRSIAYTANGSGSVVLAVTVTNYNGCSASSGNKTITVVALPVANITAAASVCGGSGSNTASVTNGGTGTKYCWSISNGCINSGSSTNSISYTAGSSGSVTLSVTVTNSSGCKTTSGNKVVTILAVPNASITASSVVCSGSTGNSASVPGAGSGASYSWTITGGTISAGTGTSSIKYSAATSGYITLGITVTNSNGCRKSASKKITIAANVIPTFAQIGPLCKGSKAPSLQAKSTNGVNGSWSPSTISTASLTTTTYTFTPAGGQCASSSTMKITIKNCTTLSDANIVSNEQTISKAALAMDAVIQPNPSENFFTLVIKGNRKEVAEVRIMDVEGRWLDHFRLGTGSRVQFGGNYAHGTYIVQVIQGRDQKQLKVIKL